MIYGLGRGHPASIQSLYAACTSTPSCPCERVSNIDVFLTGATGFIGGAIAQRLLDVGHRVRGLVRDPGKAEVLVAQGMTVVVGNLDDSALLTGEAQRADAVVNAASSDHEGAVDALLKALGGSGKAFLHTSGSSVIGDDAQGASLSEHVFDEDTPFVVEPHPVKLARLAIDRRVQNAAASGVRSAVLCNTLIYGAGVVPNTQSVQIPALVKQARDNGVVRVVGSGVNRWSTVYVADMAQLYGLALAAAPAGAFYFVENGESSFAAIGAAIAVRLHLGHVEAWTLEQAGAEWGDGFARYALGSNSRVRGRRARRELGWAPRHGSVTDWIAHEMAVD